MIDIIKCILTENDCYKNNRYIEPSGICVHSTGANNTSIARYVQPVAQTNKSELLSIIGTNQYGNHWNKSGVDKCVHGFIGSLKDGKVGIVQTLPWNWRGWHIGSGAKGSLNNSHISFEICEDSLTNKGYFDEVMEKAQELCAYLCKEYHLDPTKKGVIVSHHEGYLMRMGSAHADIDHWLKKFGKDMDWFRSEVIKIFYKKEEPKVDNEPSSWAKEAWDWAKKVGITDGSRPHESTTREELVTMIYRYYKNDFPGLTRKE